MSAISIFPDFCQTCDRQIDSQGEVYCSQQCRLADLCTSPTASGASTRSNPAFAGLAQGPSLSSSRHLPSTSVSSSSSYGSQPSRHSGTAFVLPPAYDFSSHRHSTLSNASTASTSSSSSSTASVLGAHRTSVTGSSNRPPSGHFAFAGTGNMLLSSSEAAKKTLSPTSSRSSITSNGDELRAYESGFDVTRAWRRRRASIYDSAWKS